jgi:hypothetical protein
MLSCGSTTRKASLIGLVALSLSAMPVFAATYEQQKLAAVKSCRAIDPAEYQSGLIFNPEGYRSYYVRSECFQRTAVRFRDESLCRILRGPQQQSKNLRDTGRNSRRFADFTLNRAYKVRATLILEVGNGGQSGFWSEAFIEQVFPVRERSPSLEREIRF